jgi:Fe-S-cluster containining protein
VITDLVQIRRLGATAKPSNEKLRQHMKRHGFHQLRFRRIAEDFEAQIDCRTCANCCRRSTVRLNDRDIERLAKALKRKPRQVIEEYAMPSEDEGLILRRTEESGCVFLDGNDCLVYEARPDICRDYPHLVHGPGSLVSRMWHMPDRAAVCPIVYNTLEAYKEELGVPTRA